MSLTRSLRSILAASTAAVLLSACADNGTPPMEQGIPALDLTRPAAGAAPPANETVAYQANAEHTGYVEGTLRPPLRQQWAVNFGGLRGSVGYPIVANGIIVVPAENDLVALSAKTGRIFWTKPAPAGGGNGWNAVSYDNGVIFASPFYAHGKRNLGIFAFDEKTGKQLWAKDIPGQYSISAPPTAASGMVYVSAAGVAGTVYAYTESKGALKWTASVENGDESSPLVAPNGIYVSYTGPQAYDFNPKNGDQIWHYDGGYSGGGGSTPALYQGLIFVEKSYAVRGYDGAIFAANTGILAGGFTSYVIPAFAHDRGFFVTGESELEAVRIPSIRKLWTATLSGSDYYLTPPLVVGNTVFIETMAGELMGYNQSTGAQVVTMNLGYGSGYQGPSLGLGYGSGLLLVPRGSELIALKGS